MEYLTTEQKLITAWLEFSKISKNINRGGSSGGGGVGELKPPNNWKFLLFFHLKG